MNNVKLWPEFIESVEKGDIQGVKSYITSQIMNDPTFRNADCHKYVEYALEKGIDIIEPYKMNASEEHLPTDKKEWDKGLFYDKVEDLRLNFAYYDRIKEIEQLGKVAFAEDDTTVNKTVQNSNTKTFHQAPQRSGSPKKKTSHLPTIGVIAAAAIVVAAVVVIFKK